MFIYVFCIILVALSLLLAFGSKFDPFGMYRQERKDKE